MSSAPSSFVTLACGDHAAHECIGCICTIGAFHPDAHIYVLVDKMAEQVLETATLPRGVRASLHLWRSLDPWSNMNRRQMEAQGVWLEFMLQKTRGIEWAMRDHPDVAFIDGDTILLSPIVVDKTKQIAMTPHNIRRGDEIKYGRFNGGFLWTRVVEVAEAWRKASEGSRFFEQSAMEDLERLFDTDILGDESNLGWWRLVQNAKPSREVASWYKPDQTSNTIVHVPSGKPVTFIHTHFDDPRYKIFNEWIMRMLRACKAAAPLAAIDRVRSKAWVVRIPKQPQPLPFKHVNDTFRALAPMWHRSDVSVREDPSLRCCPMLGADIVLYDWDTHGQLISSIADAALVLIGNDDVTSSAWSRHRAKPWIFWPRAPRTLMTFRDARSSLPWEERDVSSIFIGNYENAVQQMRRKTVEDSWNKVIQHFELVGGPKHKYSPIEYLSLLSRARFGLSLPGYGLKCNREIELLALGTVPLVTPEVSITSYHEPLRDGVHVLVVTSPEDARARMDAMTKEDWSRMSRAGMEWYERNASVDGSLLTTLDIVCGA